jgi:hypothetical protein
MPPTLHHRNSNLNLNLKTPLNNTQTTPRTTLPVHCNVQVRESCNNNSDSTTFTCQTPSPPQDILDMLVAAVLLVARGGRATAPVKEDEGVTMAKFKDLQWLFSPAQFQYGRGWHSAALPNREKHPCV